MFHSDEKRNRNVEPYDESQQPATRGGGGSTTTTSATIAGPGTIQPSPIFHQFELGCTHYDDIDPFGFDFDCDFGGRGETYTTTTEGSSYSTTISLGQPQSFPTFTAEDQWPI